MSSKSSNIVPAPDPGFDDTAFHDAHNSMAPIATAFDGPVQHENPYHAFAPLQFAPYAIDTTQPGFTASNSTRSCSSASTIFSPHQFHFDTQFASSANHSRDGTMYSEASSFFDSEGESSNGEGPTRKKHRRSEQPQPIYAPLPATSWNVGRQRTSVKTEPGSARAVYLEKNRKAASKCRTKQKLQQEVLVDKGREFGQKNAALRMEVALLTADVRGLMEMVGKHAGCPDQRLQTYVQNEANRLVSGDKDNVAGQLLSFANTGSP